jgi:NAD-dependent DNA ligase
MMDIIKKIKLNALETISNLSVKELEEIIEYVADKYYNTSISIINDATYDLLIDFLRLRDPKSKILKNIGAPVKSKNKVKLDYHLGSMDKIKPADCRKFDSWIKKYKAPYNLSDKLDGVSALLVYKKDESIKLFTRGTATEGQDITVLIKYLKLPSFEEIKEYVSKKKIVSDDKNNLMAFRGELIINQKIFEKNWSKTLKNARNSVSGLVNSKNINSDLAKDTNLVLYEVVDPFLKIDDQFKMLNELGFKVVKNKTVSTISFEILSKYLRDRRSNSEYLIDGIIITDTQKHDRNTDGNPEYAFAFKDILEDQITQSTIIKIEWNISKNGYLNPTVIIEPVCIGGVEIKRVSAHNAKYVVDNKLGVGAIIEIIRSGDVIPYIQKVIKPALKTDLPKGTWYWNETEVDIISNDMESDELKIKNLQFFFSTLNTKGMGKKNVEKIYYSGLNTIEKILKAKESDLLKIEGFKEKTSSNLILAIKESLTNVNLARLIAASNALGEGIGERRLKQVLDTYPNLITDYKKWTKKEFIDKIKELEGWEDKTSSVLVNNFDEFIKFYNKIKSYITLEKKIEIKQSKLTGLTIVLTGFRDNDLQEKLEAIGVKISSSVSKNTDYLVVKDKETINEGTSKVIKAQDAGVKIITKEQLIKLIG